MAEPASQAFGITSGVPGTCRARKAARTSAEVIDAIVAHRPAGAERSSATDVATAVYVSRRRNPLGFREL